MKFREYINNTPEIEIEETNEGFEQKAIVKNTEEKIYSLLKLLDSNSILAKNISKNTGGDISKEFKAMKKHMEAVAEQWDEVIHIIEMSGMAESDQSKKILDHYADLKKMKISDLKKEWSLHFKVGNPSDLDKEGLISDILRSKHGNKRVDLAFGMSEAAIKKGDKVKSKNQLASTMGVKGVVDSIEVVKMASGPMTVYHVKLKDGDIVKLQDDDIEKV
jgi:hypothetical protein